MPDDSLKILLVEDSESDSRLLQEVIKSASDSEINTSFVQSLGHAMNHLKHAKADVVLLDLSLPDSSGLDTVKKFRSNYPDIPIVVLTGIHDEKTGLDAVRIGVQDYLVKGEMDGRFIVRSVRYAIERKKREKELQKLNQTLKAISNSSQAMLHSRDEAAYLAEICRIIVEDCCFAMVWIGFAENDKDRSIRPAAYAGFEEGYLETLKLTWSDTERGQGPTGTAIRLGKVSLCRNMLTDSNFRLWREEALKRGYASSIVLPLMADNKAIGAVNIYSKEPDSFSEDEIQLLTKLADDLAYGISALRIREARLKAEEALIKSEERFRSLFEKMTEGFALHEIVCDEKGTPRDYRFLDVNPSFEQLTGLKREDVIGRLVTQVLPDEGLGWIKNYGEVALTGKSVHFDNYAPSLNRHYDVFAFCPASRQFAVLFTDITQRKLMEKKLQDAHDELEQRVIHRTAELANSIERLRFTMDNMSEGCMIIDHQWKYLYVNDSAAQHGRFKREDLIGRTMLEMYPGIEKSGVFANYQRSMQKRIPLRFELDFTFSDGVTNWYEFSVQPVPEGIFVLSVDITERRQMIGALEQRHRELLTFFKLSEIVLSTNTLDESFNKIVDEICTATDFPMAGIGIYDETRRVISLRGLRNNLSQPDRPVIEIPVDNTPAGVVVQTGKPLIERHLLGKSKYQTAGLRRNQVQTFVGYPLKAGRRIVGCLSLLHTEDIDISKHTAQWIESLANYVAVLIDRKHAEEELRLSREQLREFSKHSQSAIEKERRRIAREIHDELGQQLSLLQLELILIRNKLPKAEKSVRRKTKSMIKVIDSSIQSVQRISADLRPALLDDLGLGAAVEWAAKEFQKRTNIKCKILIDPPDLKLDQERSTALFRILQEALTNILRHAKATRVQVQLTMHDKTVELSIVDNGIGISPLKVVDFKSIGLTGMRERVYPWGGNVSIIGVPHKRTEVKVKIPTAI